MPNRAVVPILCAFRCLSILRRRLKPRDRRRFLDRSILRFPIIRRRLLDRSTLRFRIIRCRLPFSVRFRLPGGLFQTIQDKKRARKSNVVKKVVTGYGQRLQETRALKFVF